jgi:tyrosine-protein phosphatase SIW14
LLSFRSLRIVIVAASFSVAVFPTACRQATDATPAHTEGTSSPLTAPAEKLNLAGVSNAAKISDQLIRGAQPSEQGFAELKQQGVTTIVNLRQHGHAVEWERNVAESLGLRFVNIPVPGWSPPSDAQVAQFLKLFHDAPGQRVFVHCYYGDDRTGVMVATYRIAQQNWTAEQVVKEMYSFGFHYYLYPNMKSYVCRFPANFATASVFSSFHAIPAPAPEAKRP